jgi:glycosyltransferase involved in cell wall biosynthesis
MPVYNEVATLRAALLRLLKTELPVSLEVIVVDDGSTDGSGDSISDITEGRDDVTIVRNPSNLGKGAAFRAGLDRANGTYVTILDADMEYDPSDYVAVLRPILDGDATVVFGTRTFGSHTAYSFWYVIGNRFISLWASFLFDTWLSDIETCFKVAPTATWREINLRSLGFGLEAEATGKLLRKHRIYEVPITYCARSREEGKKLNWTDGVAALWILLRVRLMGR